MFSALRRTALAAAVAVAAPAGALDIGKPLVELMHQAWSVDEGLPHSAIRDVTQTADGYLWFATHEGVARFDSLNFTVFNEANTPLLRGSGVVSLLAAKDGSLYLGLREGGIVRFHGGKFEAVAIEPALPAGQAALLSEDSRGVIWASLGSGGLGRIEGGRTTVLGKADGLPGHTVTAVRPAANGDVWIGTANGLAVLRDGKILAGPTASWLDRASIADVLVDSKRNLWVATAGEGLALWDGSEVRRLRRRDGLASESLTRLLEDRHGGIWVGSLEGVHRVARDQPDRIERFTAADGLSNNNIRSLAEDSESGIWVGTDQGANRLRESLLINWGARRGISEEFSRAVLEDRKGRVWVATADGLFAVTADGTRRYGREQGLLTSAILSLAEDADGTLWIGTNGGGLHRMSGEKIELVSGKVGLNSAAVRAILPARDGTLWIGTATNLVKWSWKLPVNDGPGLRVSARDGQPVEQVTALYEGRAGEIWIGTRTGVGFINAATGSVDLNQAGLSRAVLSINGDVEGRVWVNLVGYGAVRVEGQGGARQVRRLTREDGVPEQSYFVALDDQRGNMWFCGTRGILKLSKSQVDERLAGRRDKIEPAFYTRADGMAATQCNGATQPAGWRMKDGRLLFPTAKGIAVANPLAKMLQARRAPPVHLRSISVDGAAVRPGEDGRLVLPAGSHRLEVTYVGLSFSEPEKVRYRYRLEGFDDSWVEAQRETKAAFTNLRPGKYLFRVRSAHEGGEWNEQGASLQVEQLPQFFETIWFRWGMVLAILLTAATAYRARVRQLESQRTLLSETVVERTQELQAEKQKLESASNERARLLLQVAESARAYEKLSKEDDLTGLANRRELDRILGEEFSRATRNQRPLAVALGDVDHFKKINDRHSHAVGDEVLRSVAAILREGCRTMDLVGRYGGEEFVLVFPEADIEEARHICERLREAIAAVDWAGKGVPGGVTMSFGIAALAGEASHERLLARADARLYEAKEAGRDRVCA